MKLNRRDLITLAGATSLAGLAPATLSAHPAHHAGLPAPLAAFIADYMRAMNSPGLTLGLADRQGTLATAAFGYADLAAKLPVSTAHLFEIGSITKSFTALVVLQLQEQGKLDVQRPISSYLPWLPIEADYGEILIHHLLCHSSGLPDEGSLFPSDTGARVRQGFKPGSAFHYSNLAYEILGHLIEKLSGRCWPDAVSQRILKPLQMNDTAAAISSVSRTRIVQSYVPLHDDRPYPRHGALAPAGPMTTDSAAGSIASTPLDMTRYMHMLLNRGAIPGARIISEESFKSLATGHVKAEELGPGMTYGYGVMLDQLDGHTRLRHTGGMVSFMSAIQLDLDAGVGAFASINAQLGYRPNPVAQYALRLLRAADGRTPLPKAPPPDETAIIADPGGYAGTYTAIDGSRLEVAVNQGQLLLIADGKRLPLQRLEGDSFLAQDPRFELFPLVFARESRGATNAADGKTADSKAAEGKGPEGKGPAAAPPPVVELRHGPDWYAHTRYRGDRSVPDATALEPFVGTYYSESVWTNIIRVFICRGRLCADGTMFLDAIGNGLFRDAGNPANPDLIEFKHVIDGHARLLAMGNEVWQRINLGAQS
jgi:D-alanyl-D-alanine carboxypeptidase